jgi:two-component system OmpR family response regulator
MTATTILVADDDPHIRDVIAWALEREGLAVEHAASGTEALARVARGGVDLVVLDVLMPDLDGLTVCRRLRAGGPHPPIVFLSSRGEELDRVLGLDLGGDDYVVKPFSPRELASRVRAVLRRGGAAAGAGGGGEGAIRHGVLEVDVGGHELRARGVRVALTRTEFAVLAVLLAQPGRLYTRAQLIERAHADDVHVTERTVDTHVRRIRAKLRPHGIDPIETVHGLGYKAAPPAGADP